MARLAFSFTVFLSLLFTFSHARDLQTPFPDSNSNSNSAPNSKPQQHDTVSLSLDSVDPAPLTILSFRPIDGRPLHLRHPRRPGCHHRREIHYGNDAIVLSDDPRPFLRQARLPAMLDRPDDHHHHHRHVHGHRHHGWLAEKVREFMNLF